jgi:hypothetical protein
MASFDGMGAEPSWALAMRAPSDDFSASGAGAGTAAGAAAGARGVAPELEGGRGNTAAAGAATAAGTGAGDPSGDVVPFGDVVFAFDPAARTLVIWEGVSMYLEEAQIRSTLLAIRSRLPRTDLLLDLWTGSPGWYGRLERASWPGFRLLGEPIRYAASLEAFSALAEHAGYTQVLASGVEQFAAASGRRAWPALTLVHLQSVTVP